jgi:hypothetical protein
MRYFFEISEEASMLTILVHLTASCSPTGSAVYLQLSTN